MLQIIIRSMYLDPETLVASGGTGNDNSSGSGNDANGDGGNDWLQGRGGNNVLDGRDGHDTAKWYLDTDISADTVQFDNARSEYVFYSGNRNRPC